MKKIKIILAGTLVLMCLFFTTAFCDSLDDGKKLIKAAQWLIDDGKVMLTCTGEDRVKMVDQGHKMINRGRDIISIGAMMSNAVGRKDGLEIGQAMAFAGNWLLKKGKKESELTAEEKAKIKKIGNDLIDLGNKMLAKGKIMTGG